LGFRFFRKNKFLIIKGTLVTKIWDQKVINLGGKQYTLDDIEKRILLNITDDKPLIHAAVVCASVSCPNLRTEAFEADKLYVQMNEQMTSWMKDSTKGFKLDKEKNEVSLSKIYFWYTKDFANHVNGTVLDYVVKHVSAEDAEYIIRNSETIKTKFMDYNWRVNDEKSRLKY
jgi:hypothetical protein